MFMYILVMLFFNLESGGIITCSSDSQSIVITKWKGPYNSFIFTILVYFPYFGKIKVGLWNHIAVCICVCVCVYVHSP
jgi:hypothetical protein